MDLEIGGPKRQIVTRILHCTTTRDDFWNPPLHRATPPVLKELPGRALHEDKHAQSPPGLRSAGTPLQKTRFRKPYRLK